MCSLSPGTIYYMSSSLIKFNKCFLMNLKVILRSLSLTAKFFQLVGFDLHITVMLL